ncbi:hypothetical protein STENM223S_05251 [Streptomyces tendae]
MVRGLWSTRSRRAAPGRLRLVPLLRLLGGLLRGPPRRGRPRRPRGRRPDRLRPDRLRPDRRRPDPRCPGRSRAFPLGRAAHDDVAGDPAAGHAVLVTGDIAAAEGHRAAADVQDGTRRRGSPVSGRRRVAVGVLLGGPPGGGRRRALPESPGASPAPRSPWSSPVRGTGPCSHAASGPFFVATVTRWNPSAGTPGWSCRTTPWYTESDTHSAKSSTRSRRAARSRAASSRRQAWLRSEPTQPSRWSTAT